MTKAQLINAEKLTCWDYSKRATLLGSRAGDESALVPLPTPTLAGIGVKRITCHRKVAPMLGRALELVDACGLTGKILTFDGCYNDRSSRGGGSKSTHAWGAAVDFNAEWNGYGDEPAQRGEKGSLREIVGIFQKCGFAWGGHFRHPDGMHFEPYELRGADELPTLDTMTDEERGARVAGYHDRIAVPLGALYTALPAVLPGDAGRPAMAALNLLDGELRKAGCK